MSGPAFSEIEDVAVRLGRTFDSLDIRYQVGGVSRARSLESLARLSARASVSVATPEDILLRKLAWYREGGESSHTQWRDGLGVLRISRATFDHAYVDRWAAHLGVSDLWERARQS